MAVSTGAKSKRDVTRALLLRGTVFLHVDPRREGVSVPDYLGEQPQVVLQIGLNMPIPIPDLRVTTAGVQATLSFNRMSYACIIPWTAVFAVVGDEGQGMMWREDVPPEISAELERFETRNEKPRLEVVGSEGAAAAAPKKQPTQSPSRKKKPQIMPKVGQNLDETFEQKTEQKRAPIEAPSSAPSKKRELPPYLRIIK